MISVLMPSISQLVVAEYGIIKSPESEKIIADALQGYKPVETPKLVQVSGIPGSGKSTFCQNNLPNNYLFISFDKIMCSMSIYKSLLSKKGIEYAYKMCEMPARIIGYELLNRAINLKLNIMLEHSGVNDAHIELFKNIKSKGYNTEIDYIKCDSILALNRVKERSDKIKRYVPDAVVLERAQKINNYMQQYQKITSTIKVFDGANNFSKLNKI